MTRSLGCSMARAMASPLRVKNTAYFDIAATPPPTDPWDSCIARWLEAMRPGRDGQASKVKRPLCRRGNGAGCASLASMGQVGAETGWPGRHQAVTGPSESTSDGREQQPLREKAQGRAVCRASGQVGIERDHNYDYGGLWPSESHTVDNVAPEDSGGSDALPVLRTDGVVPSGVGMTAAAGLGRGERAPDMVLASGDGTPTRYY